MWEEEGMSEEKRIDYYGENFNVFEWRVGLFGKNIYGCYWYFWYLIIYVFVVWCNCYWYVGKKLF